MWPDFKPLSNCLLQVWLFCNIIRLHVLSCWKSFNGSLTLSHMYLHLQFPERGSIINIFLLSPLKITNYQKPQVYYCTVWNQKPKVKVCISSGDLGKFCYLAFWSFSSPPTFLGSWPLPPALKPAGQHFYLSLSDSDFPSVSLFHFKESLWSHCIYLYNPRKISLS